MKLNLMTIRIEMAKKNINQKELAALAGIQKATVSKILNGKSSGGVATWDKLAIALETNVTELIQD